MTLADVERARHSRLQHYGEDDHYDQVSAFIKSIRGSDPDAGLYWLARMLESGEDARFIARRLVILASEDIGEADPLALVVADAAARAVEFVGLPEAQLNLAQAVVHLACAPKSNRVTVALGRAQRDVREGPRGDVPAHLRDAHYRSAAAIGHGEGYVYPHDRPGRLRRPAVPPGRRGREPVLRAERPGARGGAVRTAATVAPRGTGRSRPDRGTKEETPRGRRPARPDPGSHRGDWADDARAGEIDSDELGPETAVTAPGGRWWPWPPSSAACWWPVPRAWPGGAPPAGGRVRLERGPARRCGSPALPPGATVVGAADGSASVTADVTLRAPPSRRPRGAWPTRCPTPGSPQYRHYLSHGPVRGRPSAPPPPTVAASGPGWPRSGSRWAAHARRPVDPGDAERRPRWSRPSPCRWSRPACPGAGWPGSAPRVPRVPRSLAGVIGGVIGLSTVAAGPSADPEGPAAAERAPRSAVPRLRPAVRWSGPEGVPGGRGSDRRRVGVDGRPAGLDLRLRSLYAQGRSGAGQPVAIYELEPFDMGDIDAYQACFGVHVPVSTVPVDGGATGGQSGEAALDIEVVAGLAPGSSITVYSGPNSGAGPIDTYARHGRRPLEQGASPPAGASARGPEGSIRSEQRAETLLFQQATVQGQTVLAASGDSGSSDCYYPPLVTDTSLAVDDPADQPDVTGVGGTSLRRGVHPGHRDGVERRRRARCRRRRCLQGLRRALVAADPRRPQRLHRRHVAGPVGTSSAGRCPTCRLRPTPTTATSSTWRGLAADRGHQRGRPVVGGADRSGQPGLCRRRRPPQRPALCRRSGTVAPVQRHHRRQQRSVRPVGCVAPFSGHRPLRPGLRMGDAAGGRAVGLFSGRPPAVRRSPASGPPRDRPPAGTGGGLRHRIRDRRSRRPLRRRPAQPSSATHPPPSPWSHPTSAPAASAAVTVTTTGTAAGTSAAVPGAVVHLRVTPGRGGGPRPGPDLGRRPGHGEGLGLPRSHLGAVRVGPGVVHRQLGHVAGGPGAPRSVGRRHRRRQRAGPRRGEPPGGRRSLHLRPPRLLAGGLRRRHLQLRRRRLLRLDRRDRPQPADRGHGLHPRRQGLLAGGLRRRHLQLRRRRLLRLDRRDRPQPADRGHGRHPRRQGLLAGGLRRRHLQLRRRRLLRLDRAGAL